MDRRIFLGVVLMMAVFFAHLWIQETFFAPPAPAGKATAKSSPEKGAPGPAKTDVARIPATQASPKDVGKQPPKKEIQTSRPGPRPPQTTAQVEGPLYRAVVSSDGGKVLEWVLRYRGDKPLVEVGEQAPRGLLIGEEGGQVPVAMALKSETVELGRERPTGELVLTGEAQGLRIQQTLQFRADSFTIEFVIRVENPGSEVRTVTLALPWAATIHHEKKPEEKFLGQHPTEIVWETADRVERIGDLTAVGRHDVQARWIALGSKWYLAALVPRTEGFKVSATGEGAGPVDKNGDVHVTVAVRATPTVAPGQAWEGRVLAYIGPKEYDRLAAYGLQSTVNFGGFLIPQSWTGGRPVLPMAWLGVPVLKLMNWLHAFVPNYGIVIILLTVVSKVLFYPLTVKSMRSMKAMQALQPQINNLRNKYRSDPRKLQEETLALYRKHSVNPMGGCLPMVAQVPIFYALYLALDVSVELQNAAFLCLGSIFGVDLWICDLAKHDPTYVLPVLMGVSMFVQQRLSPTMGDPRQAKMMLIMPFIFTFMFLKLPSGLVLYWFVSNVLQILQQWWMDRPRRMSEAKDAARA